MRKTVLLAFVSISLFASLSVPAYALNTRTWVSGNGVDQPGCGPIANPCRTLQYGHDQTNAGGEVNFKDSAGYGSVVITKAINIIADGVFAGVLGSAGGNAITVDAGVTDTVVLRGLSIEGAGVAINGILFTSGGTLAIANCLVLNFGTTYGTGIRISHASGTPKIAITNTTASNNSYYGIWWYPTGSGGGSLSIDHSTANMQLRGIAVNATVSSGNVLAVVADTTLNGNGHGVYTEGGNAKATTKVETSTISKNEFGITCQVTCYVGRTSIFGNGLGILSGGSLYSYGNNEIDGNTADVSGTILNKTLR